MDENTELRRPVGGRRASKISTGKRRLGTVGVDWKTALEWILKKYVPIGRIGLIRVRKEIIGESLRIGIELLDPISDGLS